MMKKIKPLFTLALLINMFACTPSEKNQNTLHDSSKPLQSSMAAHNEEENPGEAPLPIPPSDTMAASLLTGEQVAAQPQQPSREIKSTKTHHFTESWTWKYLDKANNWKEMLVFREPKTNYWLFLIDESFKGEMCQWVVGKPNGEYVLSYSAPEMNAPNILKTEKIFSTKSTTFTELWEATSTIKSFGDPINGFTAFTGTQYLVHYKGQPQPSRFFGTFVDIDLSPLYYFSELARQEGEISPLLIFANPTEIPYNFLILEEETTIEALSLKSHIVFLGRMPDSRYADIP